MKWRLQICCINECDLERLREPDVHADVFLECLWHRFTALRLKGHHTQ